MKYILPAAMMLFSIAVLATGLKGEGNPETVETEANVKTSILVGKGK